jgi:hypothetical protein
VRPWAHGIFPIDGIGKYATFGPIMSDSLEDLIARAERYANTAE